MSQLTPHEDGNGRMRASDADRDAVAHLLREALAEGRLDPDEHSDRLDAVYRAKTVGELVPITGDLPGTVQGTGVGSVPARAPSDFRSPRPVYGSGRIVNQPASTSMAAAIMGGAERAGSLVMPANFHVTALMGGVHIDLREARFTKRKTTIWVTCMMGGVGITLPNDIQVRVHGLPIMGGFGVSDEYDLPSVVDPDAPVVHVRGVAMMGGVVAEYKPRKHQDGYEGDKE